MLFKQREKGRWPDAYPRATQLERAYERVLEAGPSARSARDWANLRKHLAVFPPVDRVAMLLSIHDSRFQSARGKLLIAQGVVFLFVYGILSQIIGRSWLAWGLLMAAMGVATIVLRWRMLPNLAKHERAAWKRLLWWAFPGESASGFVDLLAHSVSEAMASRGPDAGVATSENLADFLRASAVFAAFGATGDAVRVSERLDDLLRRALAGVAPDRVDAEKPLRDALVLWMSLRTQFPERADESVAASAILLLAESSDTRIKSPRQRLLSDLSERIRAALAETTPGGERR